jgi:hypothetical protein
MEHRVSDRTMGVVAGSETEMPAGFVREWLPAAMKGIDRYFWITRI